MTERAPAPLRFVLTPLALIERVERGEISAEIHVAYVRLLGLSYEQTGSPFYPCVDITYDALAALWHMKPRGVRERIDAMERAGLVQTARQGRRQVRISCLVKHASGLRHEERPSPAGEYKPAGSGGTCSSAQSARSAALAGPVETGVSAAVDGTAEPPPPGNLPPAAALSPPPGLNLPPAAALSPPPGLNLPSAAALSPQSAVRNGTLGDHIVVVVERDKDKARVRARVPVSKADAEFLRERSVARIQKLKGYGVVAAYQLELEIQQAIADGRISLTTINPPLIAQEWWRIKNSLQPAQQHMAPGLLVASLRAIIAGVRPPRAEDDG